jgi:FkbM family methyltransferase
MMIRSIIRRFLSRRLKPHRILSGANAGAIIVTSWHDYPAAILGYNEKALLSWIYQYVQTGETWIDIGAHYGFVSIALARRVKESGRVFSFEPSITTAGCLNLTRQINTLSQMIVVPFGLADSNDLEKISLGTVRGMIDSQISNNFGTETLFTISLDRLWTVLSEGNEKIHGIKIDVQGMEIKVLQGMKRILSKIRPVVILEVHPGVSRNSILQIFSECGYSSHPEPIELHPVDFWEESGNYSYIFRPQQ